MLRLTPAGTLITREYERTTVAPLELRHALDQPQQERATEEVSETVETFVAEASLITERVEKDLARAVAAGEMRNPEAMQTQIDNLLVLLQELDSSHRFDEALRVARTVSVLAALAMRWYELARSLHTALRIAQRIGDAGAKGWALNELGVWASAAGDLKRQRDIYARPLRPRNG